MTHDALKSIDRIMDRMERRSRRPRGRVTTAPLVLAVGLALGDLLLTRLVPVLWESLLPYGLEQAAGLRGWPGLVWRAAVFCHTHPRPVWAAIGASLVVGLLVGGVARPLRVLVWLAAVGVIVVDAGILVIALRTSLMLTVDAAGF